MVKYPRASKVDSCHHLQACKDKGGECVLEPFKTFNYRKDPSNRSLSFGKKNNNTALANS